MKTLISIGLAAMVMGSLNVRPAGADDLKFRFTNPSFGGNPLYSSHLIGVAQAQNQHKDDSIGASIAGFSRDIASTFNRPETRIVGDTLVRITAGENGATELDIVDLTTGEVTQIVIP